MKIICALYDRAIDAYGPALTYHTRNEAIRQFKDAANEKGGNINKSPTDYELWQIGTYDDNTGELTPNDRERVARAEDLIGG